MSELLDNKKAAEEARCRLCLQTAVLCDSHIVPEFFFDNLYDKKHRYYALSSIRGKPIQLLQKGLREELLCKSCEIQLSRYEHHARSVLYGGKEIGCEDLGNAIRVVGIDYRKFKLFQVSLLWRLSLTKLEHFRGVSLGQYHQERLRQMLVAENPGEPWEYGCAIIGILHGGNVFKELITQPASGKIEGHHVYAIAIGGFGFAFFVSSHKPDFIGDGFIQRDGQLYTLRREIAEIPYLMQLGSEVSGATQGRWIPGT